MQARDWIQMAGLAVTLVSIIITIVIVHFRSRETLLTEMRSSEHRLVDKIDSVKTEVHSLSTKVAVLDERVGALARAVDYPRAHEPPPQLTAASR